MGYFSRLPYAAKTAFSGLNRGLSFLFSGRTPTDHKGRTQASAITLAAVGTALDQAAMGNLAAIADLYDLVPAKDPDFFGARRQLVTGILATEWRLKPGSNDPQAAEIAKRLEADLRRPRARFDGALETLIDGTLRGTGAVETVWNARSERHRRPERFVPVAQQRHRVRYEDGAFCVAESRHAYAGVPVAEFPKGKFLALYPDLPMDPSLWGTYRALLDTWLGRKNVDGWWLIGIERYGLPIMTGEYSDDDGRKSLAEASANFGAAGTFFAAKGTTLSTHDTHREFPHPDYLEHSSRRIAIAIHGQTQTTDIQPGSGSKASAAVHMLVRKDVLVAVWRLISDVLERDLFEPWVEMNYGAGAPVPELMPNLDEIDEAATWDRLGKGVASGLVTIDEAREEMGRKPLPRTIEYALPSNVVPFLAAKAFTKNEIRAMARLGPIEGGDEFVDTTPEPLGAPLPENVVPFASRAAAAVSTKPAPPVTSAPPEFGAAVASGLEQLLAAVDELGDESRLDVLAHVIAKLPATKPPAELEDLLQATRLKGMLTGATRVQKGRQP